MGLPKQLNQMPKDIKSFSELEPGSVIRNKSSYTTYVVTWVGNKSAFAIQTSKYGELFQHVSGEIKDLSEWQIILKPEFVMNEVSTVKIFEGK